MNKQPSSALVIALTTVSGLFIACSTVLLSMGKDVTPLLSLIPVLATNIILLFRVDKVEKNTNGNLSKLIDHAISTGKTTDEN